MSTNNAIFKFNNGNSALLCSKCRKIIKTGNQFDDVDRLAMKGIISLEPQYCDAHKYCGMYGEEKRIEMAKKGIKEQLREGLMKKNILGVLITRPTQKLIIMRGCSGSGKSTKAKSLVGEGIIHSTDALIEATGDYNGYFKKMVDSKDWSEHNKMHHQNFLNAKESMELGVSPAVIDNTNLKAIEAKKYVEAALKMGLDESNIIIVDVGSGGETAEVLAQRNTHNVPLETIKKMLSTHKSVGSLTIKKILESDGGVKPPKVLYSGIMLDEKSKQALLKQFANVIPKGYKTFAHHMTTTFGEPIKDRGEIGKEVVLNVIALGISDKAIAVKVSGYPTTNDIPHVTIAVNVVEGGKPYDSNKITNWRAIDLGNPLKLYGTVQEVMG